MTEPLQPMEMGPHCDGWRPSAVVRRDQRAWVPVARKAAARRETRPLMWRMVCRSDGEGAVLSGWAARKTVAALVRFGVGSLDACG